MDCKILAICDSESTYADLLAKQLLRRTRNRLEIQNFTDIDQLIQFSKNKIITYLVVSQEYEEISKQVEAIAYYYLTSDKGKVSRKIKENNKNNYIYRYQPVEHIYNEIRGISVTRENEEIIEGSSTKRGTSVIGVFNPVHRNGQTTFSRNLAKIYGKVGDRVLYLNMEEFPDSIERLRNSEILVEGQGNLGDILYYLKQNQMQVKSQLDTTVHKGKYYDTLPPITISSELRNIPVDEWLKLIEVLKTCGYDYIILDIHSCIQGYVAVLEQCGLIYQPIIETREHKEKSVCFQQELRLMGGSKVLLKLEPVTITNFKEEINMNVAKEIQNFLKEEA